MLRLHRSAATAEDAASTPRWSREMSQFLMHWPPAAVPAAALAPATAAAAPVAAVASAAPSPAAVSVRCMPLLLELAAAASVAAVSSIADA